MKAVKCHSAFSAERLLSYHTVFDMSRSFHSQMTKFFNNTTFITSCQQLFEIVFILYDCEPVKNQIFKPF